MTPDSAGSARPCLLVSDFDGTMTRHDFYKLAVQSLLPADMPDYWARYRAGTMTHFEALQAIFASINADEETVRQVLDRMEIDPGLPDALRLLERSGWDVVVTSAGCDWYIRILLERLGVNLQVWANPGSFVTGKGLVMELPRESPFFSPNLGVDKTAVVRQAIAQGRRVAFAGDGPPDIDPARLVPADFRFARADLARALSDEGLSFRSYDCWSEIARMLVDGTENAPS